jgi:hypothetical protein
MRGPIIINIYQKQIGKEFEKFKKERAGGRIEISPHPFHTY